jgi:hypothetical protein
MIAPVGQLMDWVRRFLADPDFLPPGSRAAVAMTVCDDVGVSETEFASAPVERRVGSGRRKRDAAAHVISGKGARRGN